MAEPPSNRTPAGSNGGAATSDWVERVTEALRLAAKDAHFLAYQAGTGVAYERDGAFGIYPPDPAMYEDLVPPPFQEGQELPEP